MTKNGVKISSFYEALDIQVEESLHCGLFSEEPEKPVWLTWNQGSSSSELRSIRESLRAARFIAKSPPRGCSAPAPPRHPRVKGFGFRWPSAFRALLGFNQR